MAQPIPKTLTCPQCGFENEPERVYCHNCGTKLDRSLLPKDTTTPEETIAATRKRVRKMTHPGNTMMEIKTGFSTLVWAALVAAIYLLLSPPSRPPLSREKEVGANLISVLIDDALEAPTASVLQFTEADISQHMRNRAKKAGVIPFIDFKRSYALLADGKITVGVEQDAYGLPIYASVEYRFEMDGGMLKPIKVGQYFGRLGIDPRIPKVDAIFQPLWNALKREKPLLDRVQAISITKNGVAIALKAAPPQR